MARLRSKKRHIATAVFSFFFFILSSLALNFFNISATVRRTDTKFDRVCLCQWENTIKKCSPQPSGLPPPEGGAYFFPPNDLKIADQISPKFGQHTATRSATYIFEKNFSI